MAMKGEGKKELDGKREKGERENLTSNRRIDRSVGR